VRWLNEPAQWSEENGALVVTADAATDFWRTTSYGFIRDNGHLYGEQCDGDFDLSVRISGSYTAQYDQAGAMVRVDEHTWLKTGVEYVDDRMHFSTVITLERSCWAIADLPRTASEVALLVARRGDAVEVRYGVDGAESQLAALVYLPPDASVLAGVMCAAPEGSGFQATFHDFTITPAVG
jgi:regulation of enolase protein 1 (concanavalin A-like superfamily)